MTHKKSPSADQKNLSEKTIRALALSEDFKIKGENTKALQVAQKILTKDPSCLQAAEEVSDNLLTLGRDDEAAKAAEFAYSLDKKSYIANYILGFTSLNNGKKALKYLLQANESSPNNPEILRCLGWSLFHTGKELEGVATLERALNMRSDDPLILCDLGVCLLHINTFEKAIILFEKALSLEPENFRAQECLAAAKNIQVSMEEELKNLPPEIRSLIQ